MLTLVGVALVTDPAYETTPGRWDDVATDQPFCSVLELNPPMKSTDHDNE